MKYQAFISYSHRDTAWADWLHRKLERYRVPRRLVGHASRTGTVPARIYPVFRDREELPTSADLGDMLVDALRESRYLIVICSPDSAKSRWVAEEVKTFKQMGRSNRVLCLIVDGEPNASDKSEEASEECFPEPIRYQVDADGKITGLRCEPIAADARPHGDGKADAFLKIVAGVVGVGFDALKQRDTQRKQRRMATIAACSFALTAIFAVLSIFAIVSRNQAIDARNEAVQRAEDLRSFAWEMIVDVDASTAAVAGTTEIRRRMTARAIEYLDTLENERDTEQVQIDRAGGYIFVARSLGDPFSPNLGRIADAREYAQKAVEILEDMLTETDNADNIRWRLASAYVTLGNIVGVDDGQEVSLEMYRKAESSFALIQPAKEYEEQFKGDQSTLQRSIGISLTLLGRSAEAIEAHRQSAAITLDVLGVDKSQDLLPLDDGGTPESKRNLIRSHALSLGRIGDLHMTMGSPEEALAHFDEAYALHVALVRGYPGHSQYREDMASIYFRLGDVYEAQGNLDQAHWFHRSALDIRRSFFEMEPNDNRALTAYWTSADRLSKLDYQLNLYEQAISNLQLFDFLTSRIIKNQPELADELAAQQLKTQHFISTIQLENWQFNEAITGLTEVIVRAETLREGNQDSQPSPKTIRMTWSVQARAGVQLALAFFGKQQPLEAEEPLNQARAAAERAIDLGDHSTSTQVALGTVLAMDGVVDQLQIEANPPPDHELREVLDRLQAQFIQALSLIEAAPKEEVNFPLGDLRVLIEDSLRSVEQQRSALDD